MKKKQKVTAAVIEKDGKILIARRKKGDLLAHKWEFPGGKIETDETPEQCLKRELFEEFGIETEVKEHMGSSRSSSFPNLIELMAYRVIHVSGDFRPTAHEEIRWVRPSELQNYDLAEADQAIVKILLRFFGHKR